MRSKRPLHLRWWVVACNLAGRSLVQYFFTEGEARSYLTTVTSQTPAALERYPDELVERYYGYSEGKDYGVEIRTLSPADALRRYPRIVAHMICHSLGYCTPLFAARLVLAAANNEADYCEWIASCYDCDPWPALSRAIQQRNLHKGYMADFRTARGLVEHVCCGGFEPLFASWF